LSLELKCTTTITKTKVGKERAELKTIDIPDVNAVATRMVPLE